MTADSISVGANIVTALCAIGTLGVAAEGLKLWRIQLYGEDEYQIAKGIIRALLTVRQMITFYEYDLILEQPHNSQMLRFLEYARREMETARTEEAILKDGADFKGKCFDLQLIVDQLIMVCEMGLKIDEQKTVDDAKKLIDKLLIEYRGRLKPPSLLGI